MTVYAIEDASNNCVRRLREIGTEKIHAVTIEFPDVEPRIGDHLILSERILDTSHEFYCGLLCYSSDLHCPCGHRIERLNVDEAGDIAVLIQDGSGIALKRLYG